MSSLVSDYSFALEYDGPPLPYDVPRAIPIDLFDDIPVAFAIPEPAFIDPVSLPVLQPLPNHVSAELSSVVLDGSEVVGSSEELTESGTFLREMPLDSADVSAELSFVGPDGSESVEVFNELKESEVLSRETATRKLSTELIVSSESGSDVSIVLDGCEVVGVSDEFKESEVFPQETALRKMSNELMVGLESNDYDNDDEVVDTQVEMVMPRDSSEFSSNKYGLVSADLSIVTDSSEVKKSEAFSAEIAPPKLSTESGEDYDFGYGDDNEVEATQGKMVMILDSGEFSGDASGSVSADMSVVLDSSEVVGFSDELKESEAFSEENALRKLSTESTVSSELDFQDDYDDEDVGDDGVVATQGKSVTFRDSGEFSVDGSGLAGETPQVRSEEFELRVKKGACYNCLQGNWFTEKEACLVCDSKFCSRCVLRAMGSMSEGRKCISCIGFPIMENKREKLGKSSRMLKRLLSSTEFQLVMKAEKDCEANQLRPENVCVNGKKLSQEELIWLQNCSCPLTKLKPGFYWYDKVSGFWGKVGHKPDKIITPHLNVGGTLPRNASNGNTGILINGREITKVELKMLKWAGVQCAGNPHFWVNADGEIQEEGQRKILGHIWGKPMMKLLCPVLSLPLPKKDGNLAGEEVTSLANRTLPDYLDHKLSQKLLLVGNRGSGTSTIFKQAKFLYRSDVPFSDSERQDIKFMIQSNVYKYLIMLLEGRELFEEESLIERRKHQEYSSDDCTDVTEYSIGPRLKGFSDWLLTIMSSGNLDAIFPASSREHASVVEELWNDPAIQATYGRISELQLLPNAASYFLDRVVDISRVEYEPSDTDILYADGIGSCTGLGFTDLIIQHLNLGRFDIDDADQQNMLQRYQLVRVDTKGLGETCKWFNMFEDARLVIYCVSLCDYDVYHEDENGVTINKIMESKRLFEIIVSHPALYEKEFLLVLSKFDLLEEKIEMKPLTLCEWFPDFNPIISQHRPKKNDSNSATIAQQASYYIAVKFKRLFTSITGRNLYVKVVNGLQAESVDSAIRYAGEILNWEEERLAFEFAPGESFYSEPSSFLD